MNLVLVLNSGSSSLKFALFEAAEGCSPEALPVVLRGQISGLGASPRWQLEAGLGRPAEERSLSFIGDSSDDQQGAALTHLLDWLEAEVGWQHLSAVGHRVVHGGARYREATRIDATILDELESLSPLAPLHQPHCLAPVRTLAERRPDLVQVASFDTAFHADQPALAQRYALPQRFHDDGMRRYGFHGLSYDYVNRQLTRELGGQPGARVVVAHLGSGASLCAIAEGRSIASSMGFTALDGLMMGTRSGSLDPGLVLHLIQQRGMSATEVERLLYRDAGLLGVSGISADMRELLTSRSPSAQLAVELFVYRIVREIGSLAAALEGLDHLVFTAGIGERADPVRAAIVDGCRWLGARLDAAANRVHATSIAGAESRIGLWVLATDEAQMIAWQTQELLVSRSGR
ncbi:acetate/propionate family kinase [Halomonas sp. ML-15]|uniref:acetate/propionate family kinase n=1 Tax=Halomonas sp. ML-15 TaxID=2773305 RepID=UPI001746EC6D|nr:acetate/propionate family kinase [Halomonas sp. ML-15]MBD3897545.1 acetate/propionate family kinase [Halomonas sp. ML-15]